MVLQGGLRELVVVGLLPAVASQLPACAGGERVCGAPVLRARRSRLSPVTSSAAWSATAVASVWLWTPLVAVDKNGAISDWPEGFYDQTERDLATLSGWC